MVKKLFKHEFLAWLRVLPIIYGITLVLAAMHRFIQFFENDSVYYGIINGSAIFMYVVVLIVCISAPTYFGIVRFYKHLFTGEGYLTMTLPVTPANHLWVKVLTAICFSVFSLLVCFLSGMIITAGEVFTEVCKAAAYLLGMIHEDIIGHLIGYVAEFCLLILTALFASCFLYYTCICIGQLFRKNRVLAAVGVYFGFYIVTQVLGTVLGVVIAILESTGVLEQLNLFISDHPYATVHTVLCGCTVIYAVLAAVYYAICHHIIRKKLNLE